MGAILPETGRNEKFVAVLSLFLGETYFRAVPFSSSGIKLRPAEKTHSHFLQYQQYYFPVPEFLTM